MKNKLFSILLVLSVVTLTLSACQAKPAGPATLTVMTHDSFAASDSVIAAFEQANNVKLVFVKSGDAGAALNRAILTKASPQADVFYGIDNTFLSRGIQEGIFEPYQSPLLSKIADEFKLAPTYEVSPVDYGDVCINYDTAYFTKNNLVFTPES
jgi:thiamine transport system substrate-binding protein